MIKEIKDKRSKILLAATEVFSQKGYHQARIEEIAKTAEVGKGTVYGYFSSKKELFQEMVKYSIQKFFEMLEHDLKDTHNPLEKLRVVITVYTRFTKKHTNLAKIALNDPGAIGESLKRRMMTARIRMSELVRDIIEQGVKQEVFRDVDSQMAALMFIGSIGAYIAPRIFLDETSVDDRKNNEIIDKILELFLNGINKKQEW